MTILNPERSAMMTDTATDTGTGPDRDLAIRLAALEARAPGHDNPPRLSRAPRRGRLAFSLTLVPALVLVTATAAGAVVVVGQLVKGVPGIENPGQPLEGALMECMSPPEAAAFLAAHGYTDVVWQVEAGDPNAPTRNTTSVQQSTPPAHGFVVPAAVLDDGKLHMIVDQRVGASPEGACQGMSMP